MGCPRARQRRPRGEGACSAEVLRALAVKLPGTRLAGRKGHTGDPGPIFFLLQDALHLPTYVNCIIHKTVKSAKRSKHEHLNGKMEEQLWSLSAYNRGKSQATPQTLWTYTCLYIILLFCSYSLLEDRDQKLFLTFLICVPVSA